MNYLNTEGTNNVTRTRKRILIWLLALAIPAGAVLGYFIDYRNFPARHFSKVVEGVLYRSGQPDADGWRAIKDDYGIKTVISLRESGPDTEWRKTELLFCKQNGIELVDIGVSHDVVDEHWRQFLEIVTDPKRHPVLVHCQAGSVRTGVVIAGYRIAIQGWSYEQAVAEGESFSLGLHKRKLHEKFLRRLAGEQDKPADIPVFNKQPTPSSKRSLKAIASVAPRLVKDLKAKGLAYGDPVFIRIFKEERQLEIWVRKDAKFELFRIYPIVGMSGQLGPKLKEGDRQAPEGFYFVNPDRMNPNSSYHLAFNIGYPNALDRALRRTGSAIMVHGNTGSIGCFAMTDARIEEIYALVDAALRNGQKFFRIHSFPFRMTEPNMQRHRNSRWTRFWANLKTGYDHFETHNRPPNVVVRNNEYAFEQTR